MTILSIHLDHGADHVFANGDIVSGKVTLHSSNNEDVSGIIVVFGGTGINHVGFGSKDSNNIGFQDEWINHTLFGQRVLLYEGSRKLRKYVFYTWPFEVRFPGDDLPPSGEKGNFLMSNATTKIIYALKAMRATTLDSLSTMQNARESWTGGKISMLKTLRADTAERDLNFMPSRPMYTDPSFTKCTEDETSAEWSGQAEENRDSVQIYQAELGSSRSYC